jgi:iron(III) transport system permease protein
MTAIAAPRIVPRLPPRLPAALGLALLVAIVVVLVLAPLVMILLRAAFDSTAGTWVPTGRHIVTVLTGAIYWQALASTVAVAAAAAALATLLGTALAWIFVRTTTFGRAALEQIAQMPIFIPPFVGAVAWALLLAPRVGAMNRIFAALGIPLEFDVYTHGGMAWVMGIYLAPYVMMIVAAALRSIDPSLEEAAQVFGLVAPAILSGAVLAFTIAVGLFGTPVVLGWSRQILLLTSRIWIGSQATPPDYGTMAVLSVWLIVLSLMATAAQRYALAGRSYITVTGKGYRPRPVELGRWSALTFALSLLYVILAIAAPLIVLGAAALSAYTWSGHYSLANLRTALGSDDVWTTMQTSVVISALSATLAVALGLAIAWVTARTRLRGRQALEYLVLLPISVPGIAFGVGVMFTWIDLPLAVYGTALIILFAFIGRFTAYAVRSIAASLVQLHPELEESARVFGYGPLRTFARITFPLILPSVLASWILLFSFFMTELSMVILLYSEQSRMFSVLAFEVWNVGDFSRLAALSLLQTSIGLVLAVALKSIFGQRAV